MAIFIFLGVKQAALLAHEAICQYLLCLWPFTKTYIEGNRKSRAVALFFYVPYYLNFCLFWFNLIATILWNCVS